MVLPAVQLQKLYARIIIPYKKSLSKFITALIVSAAPTCPEKAELN